MTAPQPIYPERRAVLAPRLFPSALWYAAAAAYGAVTVDTSVRYDKRCKATHRYDVADVRGQLQLTVPISRPPLAGHPTWAEAAVSDHGRWWQVHRATLESGYGRTPFFEFVIDRFDSVFTDPGLHARSVIDLARTADSAVRPLLGIDTAVDWAPAADSGQPCDDLRILPPPPILPYWQIRADTLGFIPHLSVLDLIFNAADTAPLYIRRLAALTFGQSQAL